MCGPESARAQSDVAIGAGAGGQQGGVDSPARSRQHEEEIDAGGKKRFYRLVVAIEKPDAGEGCNHSDGNDECERIVVVVVEAGGTHRDGGDEADNGEQRDEREKRSDESQARLRQIAGNFDGEPQRPVKRESHERHQTADDGVPVENAGADAGPPVGPERQEEVAVGLQGHAAKHVGEGRTVRRSRVERWRDRTHRREARATRRRRCGCGVRG